MKRFLLALALSIVLPALAQAQSICPAIQTGAVLTAGQWNACFSAKNDALGYTPLNSAGGVMTGELFATASTAMQSGFNLTPGVAPSIPANGDLWTTSVGLYIQINGSTVGPLAAATSSSFAATAPVVVTVPGGVVTYALNNANANTLFGNTTGGSAARTDFTIDGLTNKASPVGSDELIIWDVAGTAIKKATVSSIATSAGVSSIATNTGAFTLNSAHCLTNATNDLQVNLNCFQGYLSGLTISNDATSDITNEIAIAAGSAVDTTNASVMVLSSALTRKSLNAAWAVGSTAGCRDTGAISNATWFVWLIQRPDTGVVDVLCSLSVSAPTMPTNYTLKRRIGAIIRASAAIVLFVQDGNQFSLNTPITEANGTNPANTSAFTITLTGVPIGLRVKMFGSAANNATGAVTNLLFSDLSVADTAPSNSISTIGATPISVGATAGVVAAQLSVFTNASGQIRGRVSFRDANTFYYLSTMGWIDTRGQ